MSIKRSLVALLISLGATVLHGQQPAQTGGSPCDADAARGGEGLAEAARYKKRGNRCEGLYKRGYSTLANRSTYIVGVYADRPALQLPRNSSLKISWPRVLPASAGSVNLFAQSQKRGTFYRMDAEEEPKASFTWPTEVLRRVELKWDDVSVLGWYVEEVKGMQEPVYLPLRVELAVDEKAKVEAKEKAPGAPAAETEAQLLIEVKSQASIREVRVSTAIMEEGKPRYYARDVPCRSSGVSSLLVNRYRVNVRREPGVHRIEFALTLSDGSPESCSLYCAPFPIPDVVLPETSPEEGDGK